ncbi:hypothetical protein D8I24_6035 [Cupriavidus necator H850]|nr:hypothetical protein D8I24_6035 [Cupriavidus necator H850]
MTEVAPACPARRQRRHATRHAGPAGMRAAATILDINPASRALPRAMEDIA